MSDNVSLHRSAPEIVGARRVMRSLRLSAAIGSALLLTGCDLTVMFPSGDIAMQQRNLIIASTGLMLLIIIPVMVLTFVFAWRYRASNTSAAYDPDWHHSTQLEVVIWTVPLLIIIALGAMTWISTHTLDPYRPLSRLGPNRPVPADVKPLEVQVVSLDWKWLFIYPEYGIASVNELAAPVDRPILFRITSSSVWNTLYVPALAGMIYAMPGMETKLNAVINKEGDFKGLSAHYSGPGFSKMNFVFRGLSGDGFDKWIATARQGAAVLDRVEYLKLEKPSEAVPVTFYRGLEKDLFEAIRGMCVEPGKMCVDEIHHINMKGGSGKASIPGTERLEYDNRRLQGGHEPSGATVPASGRPARDAVQPEGMKPRDNGNSGVNDRKTVPDQGQGNALPGADRTPAPAQLSTPPAQRHQH